MTHALLIDVTPQKPRAKRSKTEPRWIRSCEVCEEEFLVPKIRRDSAKFCSFECRGIAQKQGLWNVRKRAYITFKCRNCDKEFQREKRRYGTESNPRIPQFCSRNCYSAFVKKQPYGGRNEQRKRLVEAEIKGCEICKFNRFMEVAHILPRFINGTFKRKNILFLCPNHHRLFDSNKLMMKEEKKIQQQVFSALEKMNSEQLKAVRYSKFLRYWDSKMKTKN